MSHSPKRWAQSRRSVHDLWQCFRVVDGDTIDVIRPDAAMRVRLVGIDAPESVHPLKQRLNAGRRSAAYLARVLEFQSVELWPDSIGPCIDFYGRTLAHVVLWQSGIWVNHLMVSTGFARAFRSFPCSASPEFRQAEDQARCNLRGLWRDCFTPSGRDWRAREFQS